IIRPTIRRIQAANTASPIAWTHYRTQGIEDPDMKSISPINPDCGELARPHALGALSLLTVVCLMNAGCEQSGFSASSNGSGAKAAAVAVVPEKRSADQVLKDMEATYKKANTYEDAGKVHLHFEREGKAYEDNLDFAVTFARPNKLR